VLNRTSRVVRPLIVTRIRKTDWAEDDEDAIELPAPQVTKNKDGTETIISYRIDEAGRKVKTTRRIRKTIVRNVVNPRVAERRTWAKFGIESGKPAGPSTDTTTVGENIVLKLSTNYKASQADEKSAIEQQKASLKETKIKCRICSGEHWTSKCPYKDTMAPEGEPGPAPAEDEGSQAGGLGMQSGSYVPPHMRNKGGLGGGERMGGKYADRDDLATLRVTNVSEYAEEQELRDLFGRWGHVTRVFLAKDRETGRAKGFAFISYSDRAEAARACDKMDGCKLPWRCLLSSLTDVLSWIPSFDSQG